MKKYFRTLELDVSASLEEVEKAYKELTEAWRPENYQNLPRFKRKAEIKLEEVKDAYERIRSYLLVKESGEDQMVFDLPKDPPPEPEVELESEIPPAEETQATQISTSSGRKKLLLGFFVVAGVLGALIFYLISNRQIPEKQTLQPIAGKSDKPVTESDKAPSPVSEDHLPKKPESNSTAKLSVKKRTPPAKSAALKKTSANIRADYNRLLTQKALSRFNRNPVRVKRIQNGLITVGYNTGPIDGVIGPQTTAALRKFAHDRGHVIDAGDMFASDLADTVLVFAEISAKHPDWDRIIDSADFVRWLDSQTAMPAYQIKKLKNSATALQIIKLLDFYKSDKKTS